MRGAWGRWRWTRGGDGTEGWIHWTDRLERWVCGGTERTEELTGGRGNGVGWRGECREMAEFGGVGGMRSEVRGAPGEVGAGTRWAWTEGWAERRASERSGGSRGAGSRDAHEEEMEAGGTGGGAKEAAT